MLKSILPPVHLIAGFLGLFLFAIGAAFYGKDQEFHAVVGILFSVWWLDLAFLEKRRLLYLLIPSLAVLLYGLMGSPVSQWVIGQGLVVSALMGALLEWRELPENRDLFTRNLYRFVLISISFFAALVIFALSAGFLYAIQTLFGMHIPDVVHALAQFAAAVGFVETFAYLQNQNRFGFLKEENLAQAYSKVSTFLLFPFFSLYTVLLALYEIKLLITWESPRGYASIPASIALVIWFLLIADRNPNQPKLREQAIRFGSLIPLSLLIYGIGRRVSEHGLTPERIYGLFWILISGSSALWFALKQKLQLKYPAFLAVGLLLVTLIPGIQVVNFEGGYLTNAEVKRHYNDLSKPIEIPKACTVLDERTATLESGSLPHLRIFSSDGDYIELRDPELQFEIDRKGGAFTLKVGNEFKTVSLQDQSLRTASGPWIYTAHLKNRNVRVVITSASICKEGVSEFSGVIFY